MLRDMGWNISIAPSSVIFTAAGGTNRASTPSNWSQSPLPGDDLTFRSNAAATYDVNMDLIGDTINIGRIAYSAIADVNRRLAGGGWITHRRMG